MLPYVTCELTKIHQIHALEEHFYNIHKNAILKSFTVKLFCFGVFCQQSVILWIKHNWPVQLGITWRAVVPLTGLPSGVEHQQYPVWLWHCMGMKWPSGLHAGTKTAAAGLPRLRALASRPWARASWHLVCNGSKTEEISIHMCCYRWEEWKSWILMTQMCILLLCRPIKSSHC